MESLHATIQIVASILVGARQDPSSLLEELDQVLGRRWRWSRTLVRRYVDEFGDGPRPLASEVESFLAVDDGFRRAFKRHHAQIRPIAPVRVQMAPLAGAPSTWRVAPIRSTGELARLLGASLGELEWLADVHGWNQRREEPRLQHYDCRVVRKQGRGVRLIEAPKPRLKAAQRWVLREILNHIPPHDAAHGFCRGRSIHTYASPHVAQPVVLKLDLQDFFTTVRAAQVRAIFRTAGYPEAVASCLTGLCTTAAGDAVLWNECGISPRPTPHLAWLYRERHLPQGAPTSPALANLAAFRLDCRLSEFARAAGVRYTRYADDFAFSGGDEFARRVERFYLHVAATVEEEGFRVHYRKTRIMRQGVRQQLAGLVINRRINVRRDEYERLKAILHNCIRRGPASQNRERLADFRAHLLGRIQFVGRVHEGRGRKLSRLFERIAW